MKFNFRAKNPEGLLKEGIVEATDRNTASLVLQKNGLLPLSLRAESQASELLKEVTRLWEGVNTKELVAFFRQFSVLIEAKVPVTVSLIAIAEETENSYFRIILKEVKDDVDDGMMLSEAFGKHSEIFTPIIVNLIHAGEISGGLQRSITFIADNLEKDYHLVGKIRTALIYPAFVLSVALIIAFLVATFIIPKLGSVLQDFQSNLPWYTTMIISGSNFLANYWWVVIILVVAGILSFLYYIKTTDGRKEFDSWILAIPVIGKIAQYIFIARLTENLGILLNSGIPVVRSLSISGSLVGNESFRRIAMQASEEVKAGRSMSTIFFRSEEIPHLVSQMVKIGEESGTLTQVLRNISSFYAQEVDSLTNNLTALLEPFLIVLLGIGVAFLVIGILLPIYNSVGSLVA